MSAIFLPYPDPAYNNIKDKSRSHTIDIVVQNNWANDIVYRDFVSHESDNGTIYHLPEFLNYHEDEFYANTEKYLIKFIKNNKVVAGIAGIVKEENNKKIFISTSGASYGGLVTDTELAMYDYEVIYELLFLWLKTIVHSALITPTTLIHSKMNKSFYTEYILLAKGASVLKSDLLLVHSLTENEGQIEISRFNKKTAQELKQVLKKNKLQLKIINGIDEETYSLLVNKQKTFQNKPTHSFEDLIKIEKLLPGTVHSLKVCCDDKLVSGIITFGINKNVLNTFYIFDSPESRVLKSNHFAYYHVLKWAKENNYKYLDFGPSSLGFTPNFTVIKFKENFCAQPVLRNTYNISFS